MGRDSQGAERPYVIQEWVVGESLADLMRQRWVVKPPDVVRVRSLLTQLFAKIIIPLWGRGTIWWDVRDANYCYTEMTDRLTLIDVDSLAAYADEILQTPDVWHRRERGRRTALARLRQMALRLIRVQGLHTQKIETNLTEIWQATLQPALYRLGRESAATTAALAACERFLDHLERIHLPTP